MSFYPACFQRDLATKRTRILPRGKYNVNNFSHTAIGGPDQASIEVTNTDAASLFALLDYLRCPIEIWDTQGKRWWWGFLNSVSIQLGGVTLGASLDQTATRVRVTYTNGSTTTTTDFTQDDYFVTAYGKKERSETLTKNSDATEAAQRQAIMLANLRTPIPMVDRGSESSKGGMSATINCNGWYRTFGWQLFAKTAIEQGNFSSIPEGYNYMTHRMWMGNMYGYTTDDGLYTFPADDANTAAMGCPITIAGSEAFYVDKLSFYYNTVLSDPTKKCRVCLTSYSSPYHPDLDPWTPGATPLATGYASGNPQTWSESDMTPKVLVSPGEQYWVTIDAQGENSSSDKYVVNYLPDSGNGTLLNRLVNGNWVGWGAYGATTSALLWKIDGIQDNAAQIQSMLATAQFIAGIDLIDLSGSKTLPTRDGSQTMQSIIEELLANGTSNNRRLLLTVTPDRRVKIFEEPTATRDTAPVTLSLDGALRGKVNEPLNIIPVGQWCTVRDVKLPPGLVFDPTFFFIESAEYDCESGEWTPTARGMDSPWELGGIRNG